MKFSLNNFLYAIKQIVTGGGFAVNSGNTLTSADGGFNQDYNLGLNSGVPASSTVTYTTSSNVPVLQAAAATTTVGTFGFLVPRDYDQATDKLIVRILAKMAGATDAPTLTVAPKVNPLGVAQTTPASVVSAALSTTERAFEFNLSGNGLARDAIVSFTLTAGAHTTDALLIYAIEVVYASCIVSYIDDVDALGIPLR